jgi:hypothetical protein
VFTARRWRESSSALCNCLWCLCRTSECWYHLRNLWLWFCIWIVQRLSRCVRYRKDIIWATRKNSARCRLRSDSWASIVRSFLALYVCFAWSYQFKRLFNSKCVFCVDYESIFLSTRDHTLWSRSDLAELSFYSCSYFIQCEFASWKASMSFRMLFFDAHSSVSRKAACASLRDCWFVWQWLTSMSCLKCIHFYKSNDLIVFNFDHFQKFANHRKNFIFSRMSINEIHSCIKIDEVIDLKVFVVFFIHWNQIVIDSTQKIIDRFFLFESSRH